jgi:TPR repeat protein
VRDQAEDTAAHLNEGFSDIRRILIFLILAIAVLAVVLFAWLYFRNDSDISSGGDAQSVAAKFLPQGMQPSSQQPVPRAVRGWRAAAWQRNDLFAQLKLGDLYAHDASFGDPVESVVWNFLALKNSVFTSSSDDQIVATENYLLDKAALDYQGTFAALTPEEREEARQRLIYILARRGAEGFIALGRLYRVPAAPSASDCPQPPSEDWFTRLHNAVAPPPPATPRVCHHSYDAISPLIDPDDGTALMYFDIAQRLGHPLADVYVNTQTNAVMGLPNGPQIAETARSRARNWLPQFEYYPGQAQSGLLHSDEGLESDADLHAYLLVDQIPPALIEKSLWLVGVYKPVPCRQPCRAPLAKDAMRAAIARFQDMLGDPQNGTLNPRQTVRLIRTAAVRGDAEIQNELGIMYTKGIGVPVNYSRAQSWFERAAQQQYGEALFNLAILFKAGVDGVPQDADKAARLIAESAIAGFNPARGQLLYLLSASKRDPSHSSQGRP